MQTKVSIIGLGRFGKLLAMALNPLYEVSGTTREQAKFQELQPYAKSIEQLTTENRPSEQLLSADFVILNIPPFMQQLEWFKSWNWTPQTHLIFISSTSVYGNQAGEIDEKVLPIPETENGKILLEEENWVKTFPQYTIVRFGGLFDSERHPGKFLSGKLNLANGNHSVNLIHLIDCVAFIKIVMQEKLTGEIFNLVHPEHPTRQEYYQSYCKKHDLPLPGFISTGTQGKIISSSKVMKHYQISSLFD